jgi:hypothetical protein
MSDAVENGCAGVIGTVLLIWWLLWMTNTDVEHRQRLSVIEQRLDKAGIK